jgi:APA family basic amino acid/polyamine antiporter
MQGVWAALLTLPRTVTATADSATGAVNYAYGNVYTQLLEYIIPADLVFYVLMVGAVFVLRRKAPDTPRPYRTPGYPFVPLVYVLLATLLTFDLVYLAPRTSGLGFLLVLTGLPVYFAWRKNSSQ